MQDILKFKEINHLKSVYRANGVHGRNESSAEHSWSCMILADYFLTKFKYKLDRTKIYELLMYHDLIEIETGDDPNHDMPEKAKKEKIAAHKIKNKLPDEIAEKFWNSFIEFEEQSTIEAKFAKAIDVFDPMIQQLSCEIKWKRWVKDGKEYVKDRKEKYFISFPEINIVFHALLEYLEERGFFKE